MTESEWLVSSDPAAMLRWLVGEPGVIPAGVQYLPSDRKLRLLSCAFRRLHPQYTWMPGNGWTETEEDGQPFDDYPASRDAQNWLEYREHHPRQANIIRDLFGNPFRPLPELRRSGGSCGGQGLEDLDWVSPWLTPTVLSLAQAAYEERVEECRLCKGKGEIDQPVICGPDTSEDEMRRIADEAGGPIKCPSCRGRKVTGQLDPVRLAILADALEEAGCEEKRCDTCQGRGFAGREICPECRGHQWYHPILLHLLSPGLHYRGCWALDLILGKE